MTLDGVFLSSAYGDKLAHAFVKLLYLAWVVMNESFTGTESSPLGDLSNKVNGSLFWSHMVYANKLNIRPIVVIARDYGKFKNDDIVNL